MNRYLTTKIAEEAAEVAQAACKHLLHNGSGTLARLEGEVADLLALIAIARRDGHMNTHRIADLRVERVKHEDQKGKHRCKSHR